MNQALTLKKTQHEISALIFSLDKHKWHKKALGERRGSQTLLPSPGLRKGTTCMGADPIVRDQHHRSLCSEVIVEAAFGVITLSNGALGFNNLC